MKKFLIFCCICIFAPYSFAIGTTLSSPNGKIKLNVSVENGNVHYNLELNNKILLENSPLGIVTKQSDFSKNLSLVTIGSVKPIQINYDLKFGKKSKVALTYKEQRFTFKNATGKSFGIIFRVSDEGAAFAYFLGGKGFDKVLSESTGFKFASTATSFIAPLAKGQSGWESTQPSYEQHYSHDEAVGSASKYGQGWVFPALFKTQDNNWVLLSETGVDRNYVASHLADNCKNGLYELEFPHADQAMASDPTYAEIPLPFTTPWRLIAVGNTLQPIMQSTMAQDLVTPRYAAKADYKAGKATWSWITLKDDNITFDVMKQYIDMAVKLNYQYCLVDNWWDQKIGREKVEELAAYAKTKNIGLILWYNSNGTWNTAPQTPKNKMNKPEIRRQEMAWMKKIGIKGIKVDFFGGDKQSVMRLYQDILEDANDFGIAVNFHGSTFPRGWDRMFPNFVTGESVRGEEYCTFQQDDENLQPSHCATLPFTRNVFAPMDYTPTVLHTYLGDKPNTGPTRVTTAAFELALPVIFYSAVQHMGISPVDLDAFPAYVWSYLAAVPTVWDETHLISGYPGKDIVMARRKGTKWYIAGINGENRSKELSFKLSFVKNNTNAKLILDKKGAKNELEQTEITINPKQAVNVSLPAYGGFVLTVDLKKL